MPENSLEPITVSNDYSLYLIKTSKPSPVQRFIFSTPETRQITNNPFVVGYQYTETLKLACARAFPEIKKQLNFPLEEMSSTVLHILRGGLNFGLKDALALGLKWNCHSSAFMSAQRARSSSNPEDWYITENSYQKVYLPPTATIIFGDVVATGTSLLFGLKQILDIAEAQKHQISGFLFFTIGGPRSEEILEEIDKIAKEKFPAYKGSAVVYIEGRFAVADASTALSVKETGTDLIRCNSVLAPEFIESQYEHPAYPIERCTIYDAGSRAFWLPEYLHDLEDYWRKTLRLAEAGMTYSALLSERFPEISPEKFKDVDLVNLCNVQLDRCRSVLSA